MTQNTRRPSGFGRVARGSSPLRSVDPSHDWISVAVRAQLPKLAAALGENAFELLLGAFLAQEPVPARERANESWRAPTRETGIRLAEFLSASSDYPVWYAELAALDRAHIEVLQAPAAPTL